MYKTLFIVLFFFSYCFPVFAQGGMTSANSTKNYTTTLPHFPGGEGRWRQFQQRFFSDSIVSGLPLGSHEIEVVVDVDSIGRLSNIQIENQQDPNIVEAIRLLFKDSPRWVPATRGGKKVSHRHKLTITLILCPAETKVRDRVEQREIKC